MKRFLLVLFISVFFLNSSSAQLSLTNASPSATIDFSNAMQTSVGTNPSTAFAGAGFQPDPTTAGRLNSNAWAVTGWSDGALAFGGTQITANTDYTRGSIAAAVTTGGFYAYTGPPGSASNPALMIQPGGTDWAPGTLTLRIQNNGTSNITQLVVSYDIFVRNDQGRSNSFNFSHSVDDVTYTPVGALDYTSPAALDALGWVIVGTAPSRSTTITGLNIIPGGFFYIRWSGADVGGSGSRDEFGLDNISLTASYAVSNTITTGTVSTPPFVLTDCIDTETGTVAYTSSGTFSGGNIFTAEMSNDVGSFASPINIGTHANSGTDPSGSINITIPAGTVGGTGYRIRVVSSNPVVTGSTSAAFTIIQQGVGGCASSSTDYYRSNVATGNWATPGSWQSSPDNSNWITATQPPTALSNTITIRNGHHITIAASTTADQVIINSGGILEHSLGTLTIEDNGASDDVEIEAGGIFTLSSAANPPVFGSGSPTVDVNTGSILRVSATGLTAAAPANGVNVSNYVYKHQSVLEYILTAAFSSSNVVFFPNVDAVTIPIFRASNTGAINVGANNPTTFNGVFESNGAGVVWTGTANKIFRNGIIGSGGVSSVAGFTGDFLINGTTATLGGAGVIDLSLSPLGTEIIFGPSTVTTLISDKTIIGAVSIQNNSYIDVGIYDLIVTGTVTNATINAYVRTNSTGSLVITNVGSGSAGKLFPIGRSTINPLFIQSSTVANYSARVEEPINPPIVYPNYAVLRSWHISSSVTSPGALISFGYTHPGDTGPNYTNAFPVEIGINVGGVWNVHQSGLTPAAFIYPNTFTVTNTNPINTFTAGTEYPFVVGNSGAILPLDYFVVARAQKQNNTGIINWTITDVDNVRSFEVQRSVSGGGFQTLATVNPVANQFNYNYTDASLQAGTLLYRIKVNRMSGDFRYSNTVAIINDSKGLLITSITPNPVQQQATITLSAAKRGLVSFEVFDMRGTQVRRWNSQVGEGTTIINTDLGTLPAGVYHVQVQSADAKTIYRFVKQ